MCCGLFERAIEVRPDAESAVVKGGDFQPDNDPQSVAEALGRFIRNRRLTRRSAGLLRYRLVSAAKRIMGGASSMAASLSITPLSVRQARYFSYLL